MECNSIRVILVGGAPMSGKSTLSRMLAAQTGFAHISTDDLGAAARAISDPEDAPDLFAAHPADHRKYYIEHSVEKLLEHADRSHRALWPSIKAVIDNHAIWSCPAIIEGWALLPDLVASLDNNTIASIWIDVSKSVINDRIRKTPDFYRGASSPELMIDHFVKRSVRFGSYLQQATSKLNLKFLRLSGLETAEAATSSLLQNWNGISFED